MRVERTGTEGMEKKGGKEEDRRKGNAEDSDIKIQDQFFSKITRCFWMYSSLQPISFFMYLSSHKSLEP